MGDCRLRFRISSQLWFRLGLFFSQAEVADEKQAPDGDSIGDSLLPSPVVASVWSADTTVEEVLEETNLWTLIQGTDHPPITKNNGKNPNTVPQESSMEKWSLRYLLDNNLASLWDCTVYPTINLTTSLSNFHNSTMQKTLLDVGWFPSANLQVLLVDATSAIGSSSDVYEDHQYNKPMIYNSLKSDNNNNQARVEFIPNSQQLHYSETSGTTDTQYRPSQVLHSVTTRFDRETKKNDGDSEATARQMRIENKLAKQKAEQNRAQKLEHRIHQLQQQPDEDSDGRSKKKIAVSNQVRKMLIKSRATGRNELKMQDRLYFHCVSWVEGIDDGDNEDLDDHPSRNDTQQDFRYFSPQDTVGHALETFSQPKPCLGSFKLYEAEMLVSAPPEGCVGGTGSVIEYRRLPVLMRFYEAIEKKYLTGSVDTVVIRWFVPKEHEATTLISELGSTNTADTDNCSNQPALPSEVPDNQRNELRSMEVTVNNNAGTIVSCDYLTSILNNFDDGVKKNKSTAAKVREMKMKSKAKGDAKRIKMVERFFLELISVTVDSSGHCGKLIAPSSSFVFVARSDALERVVGDLMNNSAALHFSSLWELLAVSSPDEDGSSYNFSLIASSSDIARTQSTSWELAARQGKIKCFGRVVLVFQKSL